MVHASPLKKPETILVKGTYVHEASKITLPENIGSFHRREVTRFDTEGYDIGVAYDFASVTSVTKVTNLVAATVYIYPGPAVHSIASPSKVVAEAQDRMTENEFERRKKEIRYMHANAKLMEEHDFVRTEGDQSYSGKSAVFEFEGVFAGSKTQLRSYLYVFCFVGRKWAIEYRFTGAKSADSSKQIEDFVERWKWFGTGK